LLLRPSILLLFLHQPYLFSPWNQEHLWRLPHTMAAR
jgi:hypothetical protein